MDCSIDITISQIDLQKFGRDPSINSDDLRDALLRWKKIVTPPMAGSKKL